MCLKRSALPLPKRIHVSIRAKEVGHVAGDGWDGFLEDTADLRSPDDLWRSIGVSPYIQADDKAFRRGTTDHGVLRAGGTCPATGACVVPEFLASRVIDTEEGGTESGPIVVYGGRDKGAIARI